MVGVRPFFDYPANEAVKVFEALLPKVCHYIISEATHVNARTFEVKFNGRLSFYRPHLRRLVAKWNRGVPNWEEFEASQLEQLQMLNVVSLRVSVSR